MKMIDLFNSLIAAHKDSDLCLIWPGNKTSSGYGAVRFNGKKISVHRLSYIKIHGDIPDNYLICHHCDNRMCFNPHHLFSGTSQDNVDDMMSKGRLNRINNIGNRKLNDIEIIEIRNYDLSKIKASDIAQKYNIHRATVYKIRSRNDLK
jgi:hypothetical protein